MKKNWANPGFFSLFPSFQYSWHKVHVKFATDWFRTTDLWCWKRPLYQLGHNHCPIWLNWSEWIASIDFLKGAMPGLFFVYFPSFQTIKIVKLSGIQTHFIGEEGKYAVHLTTTTTIASIVYKKPGNDNETLPTLKCRASEWNFQEKWIALFGMNGSALPPISRNGEPLKRQNEIKTVTTTTTYFEFFSLLAWKMIVKGF